MKKKISITRHTMSIFIKLYLCTRFILIRRCYDCQLQYVKCAVFIATCMCSLLALLRSVCSSEAGSASNSLDSSALALLRIASPSLLRTSLS